ncbi:MAG TPA: RNA-binding protein, partial [Nitrospiraceae bacterium]|nr:RNA-binding protein [Nitrospiraceae bacterium]
TSLNGTSLGDRALNVSEARPQRERGARGRSGFGGGGRGHQGFDKKGRKPNNWR